MRTSNRNATLAAAALLLVAGCGGPSGQQDGASSSSGQQEDVAVTYGEDILVAHGLYGLSGQEIVEQVDAAPDARPLAFGASVREDAVLISDATTEISVDLPDDKYYVSIAPYVDSTHECYYHSLGTCQGQLVEKSVEVTITDDSGAVLVDETTTTYTNGFVGFWLPRDVSGTISVSADERTGSVPFSTTDGSPTCITTLQLS